MDCHIISKSRLGKHKGIKQQWCVSEVLHDVLELISIIVKVEVELHSAQSKWLQYIMLFLLFLRRFKMLDCESYVLDSLLFVFWSLSIFE